LTFKATYYPQTGLIKSDRHEAILGKQSKRCLDFFISQAGTVVNKEQLHQSCWGSCGLVVSDSTVRQTLHRLRKTFKELGIVDEVLVTYSRNQYYYSPQYLEIINDSVCCTQVTDSQDMRNILPENAGNVCIKTGDKNIKATGTPSKLLLIFMMFFLAVLTGGVMRMIFLVHPVSYVPYKEVEGIKYHFSAEFSGDRDAYLTQAINWVEYLSLNESPSRFVYVNSGEGNVISLFVCLDPIGGGKGNCQSVIVFKGV